MPIGVIVNSLAILFGGLLGGAIRNHFPDRLKYTLPNVCGLSALTMGICFIMKLNSLSAVVLSLILGTVAGELLRLEDHLLRGIHKIVPPGHSQEEKAKIDTIVSIVVLFCASGTGIFGAMNSAITGDHSILFAKAVLDFFTAIIFAASLGYIVSLISIPQIIIMLILFYCSTFIMPFVNNTMMSDFKACGGIITLAAGLNILQIKPTKVINMLPALILVMPLSYLWVLLFS